MGRGNGILLLIVLMVVGWWLDTEELLARITGDKLNGESAAGGRCLARTARWLALDTTGESWIGIWDEETGNGGWLVVGYGGDTGESMAGESQVVAVDTKDNA
jgi:hypothetical protein